MNTARDQDQISIEGGNDVSLTEKENSSSRASRGGWDCNEHSTSAAHEGSRSRRSHWGSGRSGRRPRGRFCVSRSERQLESGARYGCRGVRRSFGAFEFELLFTRRHVPL